MRIIKGIILLLMISFVVTGNGVMAEEALERTASVVSFKGDVSILNAGAEKAQAPYEGLNLDQGTRIITGKDASIMLLVDTDKEITIGEKSYVTIEELTLEEGKEKTSFRLLAGKLWSSIKKKLNIGESYEIRTPNAIMGARGTKFSVTYKEDFEAGHGQAVSNPQTQLTVVEGIVAAKVKSKDSLNSEKEASIDVKQGEKIALNQNVINDSGLTVEAVDYSLMDLFTMDAVMEDLKNNPEDYEDPAKLLDTLEEMRPLVEEREAKEKEIVQPLIGNIVYESTPEPVVLSPTVVVSGGSSGTSTTSPESTTIAVTGISLDYETVTFNSVNTPKSLTASLTPSNASNQSVLWSSSNRDVASVINGLVTPITFGTSIITATSQDGDFSATCVVTVTAKPVESINLYETNIELRKQQTLTLVYEIVPIDADNKSITWVSEHPEIVTVDNQGEVTAVAIGTSQITVKTDDGAFEDVCTIEVVEVPVVGIIILQPSIGLSVGEEEQLNYKVLPTTAEDQVLTWTSSDDNYITVTADGLVKAIETTDAALTVTVSIDGGFSDTCDVTIDPIGVTGVTLNDSSTTILLDETHNLFATIAPVDASIKNVTWSTADSSVARVNEAGEITADSVGTTTITATTQDGGITATCDVTVAPIVVTDVILSESTMSLDPGESQLLTANLTPSNATNKVLQWTSSDESVATVDANGLVTAIASDPSTITITATSESDGSIIATCNVTVNAMNVDGINISVDTLGLALGEKASLSAQVTPTNAEVQGVTWTSADTSIAIVDGNGQVTAVANGITNITAASDEGGYTASCTVEVGIVDLVSITLTAPAISVAQGDYLQLTANLMPANATDPNLTWTSSNTSLATVDAYGKVYGNAKGVVTITATSADGKVTEDINLYVVVEEYAWATKDIEAMDNDADGYVDELVLKTYKKAIAFDYTRPLIHDVLGNMSFTDEDIVIEDDKIRLKLTDNAVYSTGDLGQLYIESDRIIFENNESYLDWDYWIIDKMSPIVTAAVEDRDDTNRGNLLQLAFSESVYYDTDNGFKIIHVNEDNDDGEIESFAVIGDELELRLEDCHIGDVIEVTNNNYDALGNKMFKAQFEMQRDNAGLTYWVKLDESEHVASNDD